MRKIICSAFVSLDGVMQAPGGPEEDPTGGFKFGGWTFHFWDEAMGHAMDELFSRPFDLLLGRKTYDIFAAHWPYAKGDPIGDAFGKAAKYVATRSPDRALDWKNSRTLGRDVVATLRDLKRSEGPDLLIQGSSNLNQTLIANDLIDEYRLLVFPVLLGKGKKLFGDGCSPAGLKLAKFGASSTGVIIAAYERAGGVSTGDFGFAEPSQAELERRKSLR